MLQRDHAPILAVDGGGTNCRFALVRDGERFEVTRAAANASTDLDGTIATLRNGLSALAKAASMSPSDMENTHAYLGLAGMISLEMADQIAAALPLQHAHVGDDRATAMAGALGAEDGCVIGIGTGSFFGRRANEFDRLIGGWGFVLGDEASGADLGRRLLRCALDVHDGMRAETPITHAVSAKIGTASDIVAFAAEASPSDFAALAPKITAAADSGDETAIHLMRVGAEQIEQNLSYLGWQTGERICPIGGLAPHYAPYLSREVANTLTDPEGTALDGALALAAQMHPPSDSP